MVRIVRPVYFRGGLSDRVMITGQADGSLRVSVERSINRLQQCSGEETKFALNVSATRKLITIHYDER
jgi:hypothetical protein